MLAQIFLQKLMTSTFRRLVILPSRVFLSKRRFCSAKKPTSTHGGDSSVDSGYTNEADRLAAQAQASQNLWDFMVPEKNMGLTHPFFLVLLGLTVSLHFYNKHRDTLEDEELRKRRLGSNELSR